MNSQWPVGIRVYVVSVGVNWKTFSDCIQMERYLEMEYA